MYFKKKISNLYLLSILRWFSLHINAKKSNLLNQYKTHGTDYLFAQHSVKMVWCNINRTVAQNIQITYSISNEKFK